MSGKQNADDERTDRRTRWIQYTPPPPPNFVAGGIKTSENGYMKDVGKWEVTAISNDFEKDRKETKRPRGHIAHLSHIG
jgi:hypothetical protein